MFTMHKMWTFSTLQRPTQEEKERKRRFREEQRRLEAKKGRERVGRAKTFRHLEERPFGSGDSSILEALKFRAKSATRERTDYNDNLVSKRREQSVVATSRLRFLDHRGDDSPREMNSRLRWEEPMTSSGYSSGGGGGGGNNIYAGYWGSKLDTSDDGFESPYYRRDTR